VISLSEAKAFVVNNCRVLPHCLMSLDDALGCVAAAPITATQVVPPFVNSAKDGFALRAADTATASDTHPVRLELVGSIMAGTSSSVHLEAGQAARVMTGAPLPNGADAICMLEEARVESDGSTLVVERPLTVGTDVRRAGDDVEPGATILMSGSVVTPAHIGVLTNEGVTEIAVRPPPRVGVLSTGDELTAGPAPLLPGKIRDANRPSLLALARQQGWKPVDLGIVPDDEVRLNRTLDEATGHCDAIVTTGGVSVGDLDVVKKVIRDRCLGTMRWMQVAIRPAKPFAFGLLGTDRTPLFGLSGNPVSAMVSFELFVRPAARKLAGHRDLERPIVRARAGEPFAREPDGKTHFDRAQLRVDRHGLWWVRPLWGQQSHHLMALSESHGLAVVPDGCGVEVGEDVDVMLTDIDRVVFDNHADGKLPC
jgi:molybdopterin molybdotransferase